MIIVTAVLAFMIPIWTYATGVQHQTNSQLTLSYAESTVKKITSAADLVYSQGPPAQVNLKVYIPNGIKNITFLSQTMVMSVKKFGINASDVWSISQAPLNGSLPTAEGEYTVRVRAVSDLVEITTV